MKNDNSELDRVGELEREVRFVKDVVSRIDSKESFAQKLLSGTLISFILIFIVALSASSYISKISERDVVSRINDEIQNSRSEIKGEIERLNSNIAPSSISIKNLINRDSRYITAEAHYYRSSSSTSSDRYVLAINLPYQVEVVSKAPVRIIGVSVRYSAELPTLVFRDGAGPEKNYLISKYAAGEYYPYGSEGYLVSPLSPITNNVGFTKNFLTCNEAEQMLRELISLSNIGSVYLKAAPLIEPTSTLKEQKFLLRFTSNQLYSCDDFEEVEE
jgi:hypothetical protein